MEQDTKINEVYRTALTMQDRFLSINKAKGAENYK